MIRFLLIKYQNIGKHPTPIGSGVPTTSAPALSRGQATLGLPTRHSERLQAFGEGASCQLYP